MLESVFSWTSWSWWSIFWSWWPIFVLLPLVILLLGLAAFLIYHLVYLPRTSPLKLLPGPEAKGIFGSQMFKVLNSQHSAKTAEDYVKTYGRSVRVQGLGIFDERLWTLDPVSIAYILNRPTTYQKPREARAMLTYLLGDGIAVAEGAPHSRQRRVIAPTFSNENLMALLPIFFSKAQELSGRWDGILNDSPHDFKLDVASWCSRATIDVIGLAAFDYAFDSIRDETNEVYRAFKDMFEIAVSCGQKMKDVLSLYFPLIRVVFPDERTRIVKSSHATIRRVGAQLIQDKTQAILESQASGSKTKPSKDLLSRLITANMTAKLPELSFDDLLNQISTFISAGSDSTALALTWTLWQISLNPELQQQLREEVLSVPVNTPSATEKSADTQLSESDATDLWREIDALPLLGNTIKESLRLIPPVHSSIRVAMEDDEIPTSEAVKMKDGFVRWGVQIRKGQKVHVNIEGFNLDKSVWGEDAWEFKPDRWNNLPHEVRELSGVYSNLMTFSSGPRSCLGFKLALLELKIFLHTLLSRFTFSDPEKIVKVNVMLTRPYVAGKWDESRCPILVRPYTAPATSEDIEAGTQLGDEQVEETVEGAETEEISSGRRKAASLRVEVKAEMEGDSDSDIPPSPTHSSDDSVTCS